MRPQLFIVAHCLTLLCLAPLASCWTRRQERRFNYGYVLLWTEARRHCFPQYPGESVAAGHQGLAVAHLSIASDGSVNRVSVIQAPDAAIARSVERCALTWLMSPVRGDGPRAREGKLFFYFVIAPGGACVYTVNDPLQKKALIALKWQR